jgi:hypothetical protein
MQTSYDFWKASQAKRTPIKKLEAQHDIFGNFTFSHQQSNNQSAEARVSSTLGGDTVLFGIVLPSYPNQTYVG